MSSRMTSRVTRSATSSPVSVDGPTQLDWLDILMIGNSGQAHAHVSPSALLENSKAKKTKGISGRSSSTSSEPEGPLSSWENKLRLRLERIGSTECNLTWKASATPAGRQLFRLVPSTPESAGGHSSETSGCPVCAGTRRVGPYWPGGISTICGNCNVDHTISEGLEGQRRHGDDGNKPGWINAQQAGSVTETSGPISDPYSKGSFPRDHNQASRYRESAATGHWSDGRFVIGADGKARRVEPGIRLLAHGVPARVGKLRAYGNAIVPQVAAEVIGAYMQIAG